MRALRSSVVALSGPIRALVSLRKSARIPKPVEPAELITVIAALTNRQ